MYIHVHTHSLFIGMVFDLDNKYIYKRVVSIKILVEPNFTDLYHQVP